MRHNWPPCSLTQIIIAQHVEAKEGMVKCVLASYSSLREFGAIILMIAINKYNK